MLENEEELEEELEEEIQLSKNYETDALEEYSMGKDGEMEKVEEPSAFDQIRVIARKMNITIQDPKPNCEKCGGSGMSGVNSEDKTPIVCSCVFPNSTNPLDELNGNSHVLYPNRKMRRKMKKQERKPTKISSNKKKNRKKR